MIKRSLAALLWLCLSPLASWPIHILRRRTKPASQLEKVLKLAGGGLVGIFILIQFIPVSHDNPEVTQEVQWVSTETRALAQSACFDCHSNETIWPWYSYVAPASWFLIHHVEDGRRRLNFSEWDQPNENEREITKSITSGEMPLWDYLLLHPEAELTEAETQVLIDGLEQTLTNDPPIERQGAPPPG